MNEVITASKIVQKFSRFHGQDIFKIYYDCEHCRRTHSHGMVADEWSISGSDRMLDLGLGWCLLGNSLKCREQ